MTPRWFRLDSVNGGQPWGMFVALVGTDPPGVALFAYNRREKRLVNGSGSCTGYFTCGEPGATEIDEPEATDIVERLGGSMSALRDQIAEISRKLQRT